MLVQIGQQGGEAGDGGVDVAVYAAGMGAAGMRKAQNCSLPRAGRAGKVAFERYSRIRAGCLAAVMSAGVGAKLRETSAMVSNARGLVVVPGYKNIFAADLRREMQKRDQNFVGVECRIGGTNLW